MKAKRCVLIILDGWGISPSKNGNAIYQAGTPNIRKLKESYPMTRLQCAGEAVGLPDGIMGNSEVGHMNIGAGRIVYQDILRIDMAIRNGSFFDNSVLNGVMDTVYRKKSALHLLGLVSDGGVHSHIRHLFALLDLAKRKGLERVYIHAITDGRDTAPDSGKDFIRQLQDYIDQIECGRIASVCGRYYAMDRDTRWDRTEEAYRLYTQGEGIQEADPVEAVRNAYERKETDEFIKPVIITDDGVIKDNDGVIFFNFRADRARQITRALTQNDFDHFERRVRPNLSEFVMMTRYEDDFDLPVAFPPERYKDILGEVIAKNGLKQLRIAETEKYAHVTYFFNGGEEKPFDGEDRRLIPSPRDVPTYDYKPEMSAPKVTDELLNRLDADQYDFIVVNFANMDMVGHTGIMDAAIKACKTVDESVGKIVDKVRSMGNVAFVTADHGNAEKMRDERGEPHTAHTLNPVPFILVDDDRKDIKLREGVLGDIAPTVLEVMGIEQPEKMTGSSLIIK